MPLDFLRNIVSINMENQYILFFTATSTATIATTAVTTTAAITGSEKPSRFSRMQLLLTLKFTTPLTTTIRVTTATALWRRMIYHSHSPTSCSLNGQVSPICISRKTAFLNMESHLNHFSHHYSPRPPLPPLPLLPSPLPLALCNRDGRIFLEIHFQWHGKSFDCICMHAHWLTHFLSQEKKSFFHDFN